MPVTFLGTFLPYAQKKLAVVALLLSSSQRHSMKNFSLSPVLSLLKRDGRDFQILSLLSFLSFGILLLEWEVNPWHILAIWLTALSVQLAGALLTMRGQPFAQKLLTLKSAIITSLSLSIILRADAAWTMVAAAAIAIGSKFVLRINGKHLFNPANIGIVIAVKFMHSAWISPAQWGNDMTVFFLVATAGLFVLLRVQRLDTSLAFLAAYFIAEYSWNCLYLGWSLDFILHKFSSGSLYLFTFFMITDPKTTPDARPARMVWTALTALIASMLGNVWYMNATPLLALVLTTPFVPLIDKFFPASRFRWDAPASFSYPFWRKSTAFMSIVVLLFSYNAPTLNAFCGFYAARADITLYNKASQVILVRDGEKTIVTMGSDFKGEAKDFAMIIPVPNVPQKEDIRVSRQAIFDVLDGYSTPRLAEYYDQSPCVQRQYKALSQSLDMVASVRSTSAEALKEADKLGVKIEAEYSVGEYDIVILSAEQSGGLMQWLNENGYKIPPRADEVLEPYIKNNLKFFVAKVNLKNYDKEGFNKLRPLQITYSSSRFMLPIRLGMANSDGAQDLTIYAFSKKGHVETVNYRTVKMPTDKDVPLFVRNEFAKFYLKVFDRQYKKRDRGVVFMEYAWDLSARNYMHCDPCASPPPDIATMIEAGVSWAATEPVYITRLHARYTRDRFPQDLVLNETYDKNNYQIRYVVHHPASDFSCSEANAYLDGLHSRREDEVESYENLTGISADKYTAYINEYDKYKK